MRYAKSIYICAPLESESFTARGRKIKFKRKRIQKMFSEDDKRTELCFGVNFLPSCNQRFNLVSGEARNIRNTFETLGQRVSAVAGIKLQSLNAFEWRSILNRESLRAKRIYKSQKSRNCFRFMLCDLSMSISEAQKVVWHCQWNLSISN